MKSKLPAVAVFIFILIVMFFLFPRGCNEVTPATLSGSLHPTTMIGVAWI